MFMTKPETKLRDSKIFPMRIQPLLCRGEILSLGFYDLDTLSYAKRLLLRKSADKMKALAFRLTAGSFTISKVRLASSEHNLVYMKQENSPKSARYFQKTNE